MKKAFAIILMVLMLSASTVFFHSTKADNTNLAPIPPASFWTYNQPPYYQSGWCINNPWTNNGYASKNYYEYPVTKGGQTCIELNSDPAINTEPWGETTELDGPYIPINVGDIVYFSASIWTDASTLGDTASWHGADIGCDIQHSNTRVCQIDNDVDGVVRPDYITGDNTYPYSGGYDTESLKTVPFGSGAFVTLSFSFTIASSYQADGYLGYSVGTTLSPTTFAPWIQVHTSNPTTEMANVWISNTDLEINPSSTPTPTPTPTASPTPTPTPPPPWTPTPTPTPTPTQAPIHAHIDPTQTVTVNMATSAVETGTYQHTLSPTYGTFTATFTFSNTTLQGNEIFFLKDSLAWGSGYGWTLIYTAPNLRVADYEGSYIKTFSGVPSTVTLSFDGTTLTCNGQSFTYDGVNDVSENYINSSNPITQLLATSNGEVDSGTVTLSISGYSSATPTPTPTPNPTQLSTILFTNPVSNTNAKFVVGTTQNLGVASGLFVGDGNGLASATFYLGNNLLYQWSYMSYSGALTGILLDGSFNVVAIGSTITLGTWGTDGETFTGAGIGGVLPFTFTFSNVELTNGADYRVGFYISATTSDDMVLAATANGNYGAYSLDYSVPADWTTMTASPAVIVTTITAPSATPPTASSPGGGGGSVSGTLSFSFVFDWILWAIIILGLLMLAYIVARAKTKNDRGK